MAYLTRATQLRAHHLARGLIFRLVRAGKPCPGAGCYRLGPTRLVLRITLDDPQGIIQGDP